MARDTVLNFRITAAGRTQIEEHAAREERSVGDMCRILLREALEQRARKVKR